MKSFFLLIQIISITLIGCTSGTINKVSRYEPISNPKNDYQIEIIDKRSFISKNKIIIPAITINIDEDFIAPQIPNNLKAILNNYINDYSKIIPLNYKFNIEIIEGFELFYAETFSETEYVKINLSVSDIKDPSYKYVIESKIWGKNTSLDASLDHIDAMFDESLIKSFNLAFYKWVNRNAPN
jgi:hypothetical protein